MKWILTSFILMCNWTLAKDRFVQIIKHKDRNKAQLDLNQNGKMDYFRKFHSNGKVSQAEFDANEDGKSDYIVKYDFTGLLISEHVDRNQNGHIDLKILCNGDKCAILQDNNHDQIFEIKENIKRHSRGLQDQNQLGFLKYFK